MIGGEIYAKKIPSMKVTDVVLAVDKNAKQEEVGKRPGEKLHEQMKKYLKFGQRKIF